MAFWIRSPGTVSVNNGSNAVTGSGTTWVDQNVKPGWWFFTNDNRGYEILNVNSNTSITLAENYQGTTVSGGSFRIVQNAFASQANILQRLEALISLISNPVLALTSIAVGSPTVSGAVAAFKGARGAIEHSASLTWDLLKGASTDTAFVRWLTGTSTRARAGTDAADDFTFDVSGDGSSFTTGLKISNQSADRGYVSALRLRTFGSGGSVSLSSTDHLAQLGLATGSNLAFSNTAIQARNNGAAAALNLNPSGGDVTVGSGQFRVGTVTDPTLPDYAFTGDNDTGMFRAAANTLAWSTAGAEGMRLLSTNTLLINKTNTGLSSTTGFELQANGVFRIDLNNTAGPRVNINSLSTTRRALDVLLDNSTVGGLTVDTSGVVSLVAYQAGHWSQLQDRSTPEILPGTLVETIDEFCEWAVLEYKSETGETLRTEEGMRPGLKVGATCQIEVPSGFDVDGKPLTRKVKAKVVALPEDRHPKFRICRKARSSRVYGAFKEWCSDENGFADAFIIAAGLGHVRMAKGQKPEAGDLLVSDANGCAVVQDDDVIRSSTVGKVAANIVVRKYRDGSFLVPCDFDC